MTIRQDERLNNFFTDQGFKYETEIQKQAFPHILKGKDVIAISKTGTGKTLAYLMPLFARINVNENRIQAVVLAPTQELSQQIYQVAKKLTKYFPGVRLLRATKGEDRRKFEKEADHHAHLIIGTIGKLKSLFLDDNLLRLDQTNMLVIDEADMMLDTTNLAEIDQLAGRMAQQLQMLVFSATIPDNMNAFMRSYMHQPKLIKIEEDVKFDPRLEHVLIPFKSESYDIVFKLLPHINPSLCLIFVEHHDQLLKLSKQFNDQGIRHLLISGKMSARERNQVLKQVHEGSFVYVLSSDVAARGLDLENLSDVISLGMPSDVSFYTHRAGRTGRAGRSGRVFAFYFEKDLPKVRQLIKNGIVFNYKALTKNGLREMKELDYQHKRRASELDIEIHKIVKSRPKEVKPGYKKKMTAEIEQLKRKRKRDMIQKSIKEQHKLKSKLKQIEKRSESNKDHD